MKAWHFTNDRLRDGRPIPAVGEKLIHDGELKMCESGLHASKRIIDALRYAPGHMIHRVECGGEIIHQDDKLVCTERTILWTVDDEELLREFARMCALDVIHLWNAPDVVVQYLKTGDEALRGAALDAAGDVWADAARDVWEAAWNAARTAARAATGGVAPTAACAAARAASLAVLNAACAAAREPAAEWTAAWNTARVKQNKRLYRMVMRAR